MTQAVKSLRLTSGLPSSRLGHFMRVSWWTNWSMGKFFSGFVLFFPTINFIPPFHLVHFSSFQFISIFPVNGPTDVVGRHHCYSKTFNMGASCHLIARLGPVSDTRCGGV